MALATTNYDGSLSCVSVLSFPEMKVVVRDLAEEIGGSGGEVVDMDWSGDGALVSPPLARTQDNGLTQVAVRAW